MPTLQTLPDPRLRAFLEYVRSLQEKRKQEELEREASRARKRQRQVSIPTTIVGALLGGKVGGGIATEQGTSKLAGTLSGASIGAQIGGGIGQAIINEDPAAGIQTGLQGAATLANLPALQRQGISTFDVAMAGQEGLPRLLQQAQIGRRQREAILQHDMLRRSAQNKQVQAMPPAAQAEWYTNAQRITDARMAFGRGQIGQEELEQQIEPWTVAQQVLLDENQPTPPPTIDEELASGQSIRFHDETQTWLTKKPDGGWNIKTISGDKGAEVQSQIREQTDVNIERKTQEEIGRLQGPVMIELGRGIFEAQSAFLKRAHTEAKARVKNDAVLQGRILREAAEEANQSVLGFERGFRQAKGEPTKEEKQQQQEAAEQQQAAQQQQQQAQQIEQAQMFFSQSVQALAAIAEDRDADPREWSQEALDEAFEPAAGLLQALGILGPQMSLEQRVQLEPLVRLAQAIVESPPRLGKGMGP